MFISVVKEKEEGSFFGSQSSFQIDCFATTLPYFSADVLISVDILLCAFMGTIYKYKCTLVLNEVKVARSCLILCNQNSEFSRPEYWSECLSLLQGIFPTQGSNPGLLHCWKILYLLNHKGNLRVLEWAAYPFSSRSSQPRNQTGVSCIAGEFFTS